MFGRRGLICNVARLRACVTPIPTGEFEDIQILRIRFEYNGIFVKSDGKIALRKDYGLKKKLDCFHRDDLQTYQYFFLMIAPTLFLHLKQVRWHSAEKRAQAANLTPKDVKSWPFEITTCASENC
jgi:hypothetical protein